MARAKKTVATEEVKTVEETKSVEEVKTEAEEKPKTQRKPRTKTVKEENVVEPVKEDARDIEIDNLKAQIEQLKQLMAQQSGVPQQIVVTADNSERVWFLWMADVANDNQILIGESGQYGRIVGKTGTFYVPKNDLSRVLDSSMRHYLEQRWMIVVSGLTAEEREALGVNYREGELLDETAFRKIADMGEELLAIYSELCESHQDMVASIYHEAYENGKRIDRNMVVNLNKIHPNVAFKDILDDMNFKEASAK